MLSGLTKQVARFTDGDVPPLLLRDFRIASSVPARVGYGSGEALSRAFKARHGIAPSEVRRNGVAG
jgi:AraC-like DNA-binding protein